MSTISTMPTMPATPTPPTPRAAGRTIPGIFAAILAASVATVALTWGAPSALAQGVVIDDDDDDDGEDPDDAPLDQEGSRLGDPDKPRFGVGLRLRSTFIPKGLIEAFVKRAEGGHSNIGIGIEAIRRRGNLEISFGIEYESLAGDSGIWIDNDDAADLVQYDGFGWITGDFNFIWHTELHEKVAIRYGGGAGLGIITGDVLQTDMICVGTDVSTCVLDPTGEERAPQDDVPPVFPVVNILAGVQVTPVENLAINLELGMRTVFYFGTTVAYFF